MIEVKIGLTLESKDPENAITILDNIKELIDNAGLEGIKEVWWEGEDIDEMPNL